MKEYIERLQQRCYDAAAGNLSKDEMDALIDEAMGGFSSLPIFGRNISIAANQRNWSMLAGALGACMSVESGSSRTTVTQVSKSVSESSSSVHMSISQVFESVERDSGLTDEEKAELQSLLVEAKKTAASKDSGAFAKIGAKIMEGVEKATPGVVSGVFTSLALKFLGA